MSSDLRSHPPTQDDVNEFLDRTQRTGLFNMATQGAEVVEIEFDISPKQAEAMHREWVETYSERHQDDE